MDKIPTMSEYAMAKKHFEEKKPDCKQCGKTLDGYVNHPNKHDPTLCDDCWEHNQGLVPWQGHYIPWNYVYWSDTLERRADDHHEDVYASLPTIKWCDEFKKWKVEFICPDSGGYDVQHFTWYFDNDEDIIKLMRGRTGDA